MQADFRQRKFEEMFLRTQEEQIILLELAKRGQNEVSEYSFSQNVIISFMRTKKKFFHRISEGTKICTIQTMQTGMTLRRFAYFFVIRNSGVYKI